MEYYIYKYNDLYIKTLFIIFTFNPIDPHKEFPLLYYLYYYLNPN